MQKTNQPQTTNNPMGRDASVQINAKHTQGPWEKDIYGETVFKSEATCDMPVHQCIASLFDLPEDQDGEERKANAQLIAAAPELLAALKKLMPEIRQYRGSILMDGSSVDCQCRAHDLLTEKIDSAMDAINKAEGKEAK